MIDAIDRLKSLVLQQPFVAKLLGPMCDLLAIAAKTNVAFQNSDDQTLGHMEEYLRKPLGQFLAETLEQAAQQKADAAPPKCPVCGRKFTRRRSVEQTILTASGEVKVTRVRGFCSKCKDWYCPADDALGTATGYSPFVQEMAALFASKMPLSEASRVLERATGIKLPETTLDRVAKQAAQKARDCTSAHGRSAKCARYLSVAARQLPRSRGPSAARL